MSDTSLLSRLEAEATPKCQFDHCDNLSIGAVMCSGKHFMKFYCQKHLEKVANELLVLPVHGWKAICQTCGIETVWETLTKL